MAIAQGPKILLRLGRFDVRWWSYRSEFGLKRYGDSRGNVFCSAFWLGPLSFNW